MYRARAHGVARLPRMRSCLELATIAALVAGLAMISMGWRQFGGEEAAFWPANAVPLAVLIVREGSWRRRWLVVAAVWLGDTVAAWVSGLPVAGLVWLPIGNGIEVAVATAFAWSQAGPGPQVRRVGGLLKIVVAVGMIGPLFGAGAANAHYLSQGSGFFFTHWQVWYEAHALGNLTFAIALLVVLGPARRPICPPERRKQAIFLGAAAPAIVTGALFQGDVGLLLITPLLFAALGMIVGFEFSCIGLAGLTIVALCLSRAGYGPIAMLDPVDATSAFVLVQAILCGGFAVALPMVLAFERRGRMIDVLRTQQSAIVARAARYRGLAEMSGDTILVTLQDGTILYASPAAERLLGVAGTALTGRSAFDLIHPEDKPSVCNILANLGGETREVTAEMRLRFHETDEPVWTEIKTRIGRRSSGVGPPARGSLGPRATSSGVELVSVVRDVSARRIAQDRRDADLQRLDRLANTDPLTGLANRRRFNDHLEAEWRRALREQGDIALMLVDVDLFKSYNDRYGHPAGDVVLRQIAAVVGRVAMRPTDLAARIGGEEFAIILPATFLSGARAVAERIRDGIRDLQIPHEAASSGFLSVSMGIDCVCPDQANLPQMLIERADRALYQAKIKRGSIVVAS